MSSNTMLPEPADLALLRHRLFRILEIWEAYRVFLMKQVQTGPGKICTDEEDVEAIGSTLLIAYYGVLYSLFDPADRTFNQIVKPMLPNVSSRAREAAELAIWVEGKAHDGLAAARYNLGFHPLFQPASGPSISPRGFHPAAPLLIMHAIDVFIRDAALVYEEAESHPFNQGIEETARIWQVCHSMKAVLFSN